MKFTHTKWQHATVAASAVLMLTLAGCSSSTASTTPAESAAITVPGVSDEGNAFMNELYQSAIESGNTEIVMYGPAVSTDEKLFEAFSEFFPEITIVAQDQPDATTQTKLEVEAESGNQIASMYVGAVTSINVLQDANPEICAMPEVKTSGEEIWTREGNTPAYYKLTAFPFIYNTNLVKEEDVPRSWEDLLDPKWKGKIVVGDPTSPSGSRHIMTQLLKPEVSETFGVEYLEKLAAQDLNYAETEAGIPADVASERFPIGINVYSGFFAAQAAKDAPIAASFPLEDGGSFFGATGICVVNDGPSSDAATLFTNWLLSPNGVEALAADPASYAQFIEYEGEVPLPTSFDRLPDGNDSAENAEYVVEVDRIFAR